MTSCRFLVRGMAPWERLCHAWRGGGEGPPRAERPKGSPQDGAGAPVGAPAPPREPSHPRPSPQGPLGAGRGLTDDAPGGDGGGPPGRAGPGGTEPPRPRRGPRSHEGSAKGPGGGPKGPPPLVSLVFAHPHASHRSVSSAGPRPPLPTPPLASRPPLGPQGPEGGRPYGAGKGGTGAVGTRSRRPPSAPRGGAAGNGVQRPRTRAVGRVLMHHPGEEGGRGADRPAPPPPVTRDHGGPGPWGPSRGLRTPAPGVRRAPLAPPMASVPPRGRPGRRGAEAVHAKPGLGRPPPWSEGGGLYARVVARGGPASAFVPKGSAHGIGGVGGGTRARRLHPRRHPAEGRPPAGSAKDPGSGLTAVGAPPTPRRMGPAGDTPRGPRGQGHRTGRRPERLRRPRGCRGATTCGGARARGPLGPRAPDPPVGARTPSGRPWGGARGLRRGGRGRTPEPPPSAQRRLRKIPLLEGDVA